MNVTASEWTLPCVRCRKLFTGSGSLPDTAIAFICADCKSTVHEAEREITRRSDVWHGVHVSSHIDRSNPSCPWCQNPVHEAEREEWRGAVDAMSELERAHDDTEMR